MREGVRSCLFWAGCLFLLGIVALFLLPHLYSYPKHNVSIICPRNLKQIGLGLKMYAGDHRGKFPPRLIDAKRYWAYESGLFICPKSGKEPGALGRVDEWSDYVYISGLTESSPPDTVHMYCLSDNRDGEGGNVLFVDGHVKWFNSTNSEYCVAGEPSFEDVVKKTWEQQKP